MRMRPLFSLLAIACWLLATPAARAETTYGAWDVHSEPPRTDADRAQTLGVALGAALLNIPYVPVRAAVTAVGLALSASTGWLVGGSNNASEDIWDWFRGSPYITPSMLKGRERFRFGPWESGR
jgi:hypothetical protein